MCIKTRKLLYHLAPLDSLESIIENGLLSRDDLEQMNIDFIDTADHEILQERERLNLSQYVPFHFHIHTAYDTAVKNKNSDIKFIYICLHRDYAKTNNFKVLPAHPASNELPDLHDYNVGFDKIEWDIMEMTMQEAQNAGIDLGKHRQVRMAECLAPSPVRVEDFFSIYVPDKETKEHVLQLLNDYEIENKPYVNIMNWFV